MATLKEIRDSVELCPYEKPLTPAQRQRVSRERRSWEQRRLDIWLDIRTYVVVINGLCYVTGDSRKKVIEDALEMYWRAKGSEIPPETF